MNTGAKMTIATCHPARKMKAHGLCGSCYDRELKATNPKYRAAQLSNSTKWARRHPERVKAYSKARQLRDKAKPDYKIKQRDRLLKRYGLTQATYLELLESQGNACALCYRRPETTRFHVDHCHKTNRVRGILCHQCNWYLGTVDEDITILDRIKIYLGAS